MTTETVIEQLTRLVDDGDLVGIYENKDLGHPDVGRRIAFVYNGPVICFAKIGETKCHDGEHGLGWRYILIAVEGDVDRATEIICRVDSPSAESLDSDSPPICINCEE